MKYVIETFGWIEGSLLIFLMNLVRYVLFSGGAFLAFYVIWKKKWQYRKIQISLPKHETIRLEVSQSMVTLLMFVFFAIGIYHLNQMGLTNIYTDIADYGWGYFFFSIILMVFLHDTYFYWVHRWMHHPKLYRWIHRAHHASHNPTPWAAFSFHPVEAALEFGVVPVFFVLLPLHPLAIFLFATFSILMNVIGHLGYEIYPMGFLKSRWGKFLNSSTHHNMHHQYVKGNYGLYFNLWDRLMGTNHPHYEKRFEEVVDQKKTENVLAG